jgi:Nitrile hydratase beta subunit
MRNDEPSIGGAPSIAPAVADEPVFREPCEAQAFAMTVLLHERGLFTWAEWGQALGAEIARAPNPKLAHDRSPGPTSRGQTASLPPASGRAVGMSGGAGTLPRRVDANGVDNTPYYQHWLAALETLVAAKGASSPDELTRFQRAWQHAAHRTPHGQSVDLQSQDLEG